MGYKKDIFAVLRMNSNSCKNEILADARMKSANADEIFGFASDEIKSTHSPSRRISSNKVGFHCRRRFRPPARVDLVENDKFLSKLVVFWRRWRDSNSRRRFSVLHDFQSCALDQLRDISVFHYSVAFCDLSIISKIHSIVKCFLKNI